MPITKHSGKMWTNGHQRSNTNFKPLCILWCSKCTPRLSSMSAPLAWEECPCPEGATLWETSFPSSWLQRSIRLQQVKHSLFFLVGFPNVRRATVFARNSANNLTLHFSWGTAFTRGDESCDHSELLESGLYPSLPKLYPPGSSSFVS